MSPAAPVIGQLASARVQLESVCNLLLSPSAATLDRCAALMASAGETMAGLSPVLARVRGDASALEEAWRLRRTFQRASSLLGHAALFHQNWTAIRGSITGGYTPDGEPAPVRHPGRLSLVA